MAREMYVKISKSQIYPKLYVVKREFFENKEPDKVVNVNNHKIELYRIAGDYDVDFVICVDNVCYDFMFFSEEFYDLNILDIIEDELFKIAINTVIAVEVLASSKKPIPLLKYFDDFVALEEPFTHVALVPLLLKHKDTIQYPPYVTTPLLLLKAMN